MRNLIHTTETIKIIRRILKDWQISFIKLEMFCHLLLNSLLKTLILVDSVLQRKTEWDLLCQSQAHYLAFRLTATIELPICPQETSRHSELGQSLRAKKRRDAKHGIFSTKILRMPDKLEILAVCTSKKQLLGFYNFYTSQFDFLI